MTASTCSPAMAAGADDYQRKPVNLDELRGQARVCVAGRRSASAPRDAHRGAPRRRIASLRPRARTRSRARAIAFISTRTSRRCSRAQRCGHPCSLALCDLDYFKSFNDTLGHVAGDEALRRVAEAMRNNLRASDTLYRYGGEEFVVLLVEQSVGDAVRAMEHAHRDRAPLHSLAADGRGPHGEHRRGSGRPVAGRDSGRGSSAPMAVSTTRSTADEIASFQSRRLRRSDRIEGVACVVDERQTGPRGAHRGHRSRSRSRLIPTQGQRLRLLATGDIVIETAGRVLVRTTPIDLRSLRVTFSGSDLVLATSDVFFEGGDDAWQRLWRQAQCAAALVERDRGRRIDLDLPMQARLLKIVGP